MTVAGSPVRDPKGIRLVLGVLVLATAGVGGLFTYFFWDFRGAGVEVADVLVLGILTAATAISGIVVLFSDGSAVGRGAQRWIGVVLAILALGSAAAALLAAFRDSIAFLSGDGARLLAAAVSGVVGIVAAWILTFKVGR